MNEICQVASQSPSVRRFRLERQSGGDRRIRTRPTQSRGRCCGICSFKRQETTEANAVTRYQGHHHGRHAGRGAGVGGGGGGDAGGHHHGHRACWGTGGGGASWERALALVGRRVDLTSRVVGRRVLLIPTEGLFVDFTWTVGAFVDFVRTVGTRVDFNRTEGLLEGLLDGLLEGLSLGIKLGVPEGIMDGLSVGNWEGLVLGIGLADG